jgi:hypothetical protein
MTPSSSVEARLKVIKEALETAQARCPPPTPPPPFTPDGVALPHIILEPCCGKGPHDSLGGRAKAILKQYMEERKQLVPNCLAGFEVCVLERDTLPGVLDR